MFHRLGRFTARYPLTIGVLWLLVGTLLALLAPAWDTQTQDDDVRFVPDRFTSVRAYQLLEKAFPQDVNACKVVFALERSDRPLSDADLALIPSIKADLERLRQQQPQLKMARIDTCHDDFIGARLISGDRQCTLIQVSLGTPYLAVATQSAVEETEKVVRRGLEGLADPPTLYTTGAAAIGRDLTRAAGKSLDGTTWATIALVLVVLLAVYRAPLLALVPLVTIAISVWVSLHLLALMTLIPGVHLVNISKLFAIVILYGAGTDYCLFLVSRYREEITQGHSLVEALRRGVGGVGEALAASAGTVMVGLGLMATAEFAKVRCAGPAIALSLGIALLASLTLTPALLRLLGPIVFWPGKPPTVTTKDLLIHKFHPQEPGFWGRLSHKVQRRPVLTWCLASLFLLPFVVLGLRVQPNYRATGELSPSTQSLQGLNAIQRHFTAGEVGPIQVLLVSDQPWDSDMGRLQLAHLSYGFEAIDNVAEVRSLTQPLGFALPPALCPPGEDLCCLQNLLMLVEPYYEQFTHEFAEQAKKYYLASIDDDGATRHVTQMHVVLRSDPFAPESAATLKIIQSWLNEELPRSSFVPAMIRAECFGVTANAQDLAEVTESDRKRVNVLVLGAIFLILLALVRRLWLSCYLLVTVLASYYAALGATTLAGVLWTGHVLETVDWRVPFFLFTILVAVGEDYNILLVSRALEERKKHGAVEGMRRAMARTGGAITSCGLIMAGTFATLMLAGLNTLLQIGFALAFGVLVDTFIVRPFLVPAFAMYFWKEPPETPASGETPSPGSKKNPKKQALARILKEDWLEAA
jgi:RND superfamily putative drug exporter